MPVMVLGWYVNGLGGRNEILLQNYTIKYGFCMFLGCFE
jgi:hypothetical protein